MRKKLGQRVRTLRKKGGWSQEGFAYEKKFGRAFMSALENGKKDVRFSTLCKLAKAFDVTLAELMRGINE